MVRDAGMHITATNILGLPTSTLEDDLDTMRLNAEAQISYAYAFLFQPYPGTELGQFTQDSDLMVGTFDDIGEVAWDHSILVFEDETTSASASTCSASLPSASSSLAGAGHPPADQAAAQQWSWTTSSGGCTSCTRGMPSTIACIRSRPARSSCSRPRCTS